METYGSIYLMLVSFWWQALVFHLVLHFAVWFMGFHRWADFWHGDLKGD